MAFCGSITVLLNSLIPHNKPLVLLSVLFFSVSTVARIITTDLPGTFDLLLLCGYWLVENKKQ